MAKVLQEREKEKLQETHCNTCKCNEFHCSESEDFPWLNRQYVSDYKFSKNLYNSYSCESPSYIDQGIQTDQYPIFMCSELETSYSLEKPTLSQSDQKGNPLKLGTSLRKFTHDSENAKNLAASPLSLMREKALSGLSDFSRNSRASSSSHASTLRSPVTSQENEVGYDLVNSCRTFTSLNGPKKDKDIPNSPIESHPDAQSDKTRPTNNLFKRETSI